MPEKKKLQNISLFKKQRQQISYSSPTLTTHNLTISGAKLQVWTVSQQQAAQSSTCGKPQKASNMSTDGHEIGSLSAGGAEAVSASDWLVSFGYVVKGDVSQSRKAVWVRGWWKVSSALRLHDRHVHTTLNNILMWMVLSNKLFILFTQTTAIHFLGLSVPLKLESAPLLEICGLKQNRPTCFNCVTVGQ